MGMGCYKDDQLACKNKRERSFEAHQLINVPHPSLQATPMIILGSSSLSPTTPSDDTLRERNLATPPPDSSPVPCLNVHPEPANESAIRPGVGIPLSMLPPTLRAACAISACVVGCPCPNGPALAEERTVTSGEVDGVPVLVCACAYGYEGAGDANASR